MSHTCSVTVGIPTYNRSAILRNSVESALGQTYRPLRVLIADNCSTDGTQQFCNNLVCRYENVTVLHHPRNIGAIENFLSVLQHADSDYFMWMADDDWIDHNYLEECIKVLDANPDVVLVHGKAVYYKDGVCVFSSSGKEFASASPMVRLLSYFLSVKDNGMFYGVYRKPTFEGIEFPKGFGGDWLLVAQAVAKGRTKYIPTVTIHRRLGGASASTRVLAQRTEPGCWASCFPFTALGLRAGRMVIINPAFAGLKPVGARMLTAFVIFCIVAVGKGGADALGHALHFLSGRFPKMATFVINSFRARR